MIRPLFIVLSFGLAITLYLNYTKAQAKDPWTKKREIETPQRIGAIASMPNRVTNWPPTLGKPFPSVSFIDHQGKRFDISGLKGKPTLIEMIAMTCAGCQAFAGGNKYGGYEGFAVQADLRSIEEYYQRYTGGRDLHSNEINFVQIVVYNLNLKAPREFELAGWRKHFRLDDKPNAYVVTGGEALANRASYRMIPGFILLDKHTVVRFDSTGHHPRHKLYTQLLPAVPSYLSE